ncbi:MAG: translation initiation factor IF-3 [Candidatus Marinimicrobia bacterium]|nr:translation initiation factor IF-3 [Candidatus Neomarinimicrobiota bacterium]MBT7377561.1 translation initiation factor IF-3 [Candidatus Neomarinimicrobiota bacterium]
MARTKDTTRINEDIKSQQVRAISQNGDQLGVISIENALYKAGEAGLDLVEISPNTTPPVCKILDYGKYRYEKQKQIKINKKKQHTVQVKEIRLRPNTGDHDLTTKLTKAQQFLLNGDKLKVTVMFRGREMARRQAGIDLLDRVKEILDEVAKIDKSANMEGRRMSMILSPK